jgi:hypothetical protein
MTLTAAAGIFTVTKQTRFVIRVNAPCRHPRRAILRNVDRAVRLIPQLLRAPAGTVFSLNVPDAPKVVGLLRGRRCYASVTPIPAVGENSGLVIDVEVADLE